MNVGIVFPGDIIHIVLDDRTEMKVKACKEIVYTVPDTTIKAWVNGELRIDLKSEED